MKKYIKPAIETIEMELNTTLNTSEIPPDPMLMNDKVDGFE